MGHVACHKLLITEVEFPACLLIDLIVCVWWPDFRAYLCRWIEIWSIWMKITNWPNKWNLCSHIGILFQIKLQIEVHLFWPGIPPTTSYWYDPCLSMGRVSIGTTTWWVIPRTYMQSAWMVILTNWWLTSPCGRRGRKHMNSSCVSFHPSVQGHFFRGV